MFIKNNFRSFTKNQPVVVSIINSIFTNKQYKSNHRLSIGLRQAGQPRVNHKMMNDIRIEDLSRHVNLIPFLARLHFEQWGDLTGASNEADYEALLARHAAALELPVTLVALSHDRLLGSTNIINCDMDIRPELTPWMPSPSHIVLDNDINSDTILT